MEIFEDYFKSWINWKVEKQLKAIDIIANESGVDASEWFKNVFMRRNIEDFSGDNFLDDILENFVCHLAYYFDSLFDGYLPSIKTNVYGEKSFNTYMALSYDKKNNGIKIDKRYNTRTEIEDVENLIKSIPVEKRNELMKNKLFYYIINQTKLEIFSKNDIRYLKLKKLSSDE
jgi:hypothetical protein